MSSFRLSLVAPDRLVFSGEVDQVDLPGTEGDFGVLSGHAPIIAMLRPGIVTVIVSSVTDKFVVFGGLAEFSQERLTILADSASSVEDLDLADLKWRIDEMERSVEKIQAGDELDRAITMLDHYKSIHISLTPATAF